LGREQRWMRLRGSRRDGRSPGRNLSGPRRGAR